MIRARRNFLALSALSVAVAACGRGDSAPRTKFKSYSGPPVTQIVVNKGQRRMYLLNNTRVLKGYKVDLGNQPVGHKQFEGDGKTPEGVYFIDRFNPNSRYHLSVGVSYPNQVDSARAAAFGLRPGGDIFIHGKGREGRQLNRKDWTAGCIAVEDEEIEEIFAMLTTGVPIVINP